jgi:hypothetical protein
MYGVNIIVLQNMSNENILRELKHKCSEYFILMF